MHMFCLVIRLKHIKLEGAIRNAMENSSSSSLDITYKANL